MCLYYTYTCVLSHTVRVLWLVLLARAFTCTVRKSTTGVLYNLAYIHTYIHAYNIMRNN